MILASSLTFQWSPIALAFGSVLVGASAVLCFLSWRRSGSWLLFGRLCLRLFGFD